MNSASNTYTSADNLTSALNTASMLQELGVQKSQPGSSATVEELQALMEDIHNILSNEGAAALLDLDTGTNAVHDMIDDLSPDVDAVTTALAGL